MSPRYAGAPARAPCSRGITPRGGPYLFNFDHNECQVEVAAEGMNPGADPDGPFFLCMQARGYSLVTAEVYSAEAELWAELVNNDS